MLWTAGSVLVALAVITLTLMILARRFEPFVRAQIVAALQQRFHTRVELHYLHIAVHHGQEAEWGMWATGRGLRIWPPQRNAPDHALETAVESKPLIDLGEFSFHVPLRYEMAKHLKIAEVRLKNLNINVPPPQARDKLTGFTSALTKSRDAEQQESDRPGTLANLRIERIVCTGAMLVLETDKPNRLPLEFDISQLKLTHIAANQPMSFQATLTNPRPKGVIQSSGSFGPWEMADPGASPVSGTYHFENADLSVFKGIAGSISSAGKYAGTLRDMVVDGKADVPDFRLPEFGNPMPLHTTFHARVDGTNGDTWLEPVDAMLGHSHFSTRGRVVRVKANREAPREPGAKPRAIKSDANDQPTLFLKNGHLIDLKVNVDRARIEDFMHLVNRSQMALLTGDVTATATLHILPGDEPVHKRLKLDGSFKLDDARFSSQKLQDRIHALSYRGLGRPETVKHADSGATVSQMQSDFQMAEGIIHLPNLEYTVPGVVIKLQGTYALEGQLHFDGTAKMQATVSQMIGGWKGFLLKPIDPLFKKGGAGALIPIQVRGTREDPDFGVKLGKIGSTSPERPGEAH